PRCPFRRARLDLKRRNRSFPRPIVRLLRSATCSDSRRRLFMNRSDLMKMAISAGIAVVVAIACMVPLGPRGAPPVKNVATMALAGAGLVGFAAAFSGASEPQSQPQPVKHIVLVHGAFADGTSWAKVIPILEGRGFHVVAVQTPLTSLADDVNATRRI